uniref:Uncharacterized protein n=1 Tax=Strongyloides stercoralis TaxID=6248 RepID=A0A0K0ETE2_STRER
MDSSEFLHVIFEYVKRKWVDIKSKNAEKIDEWHMKFKQTASSATILKNSCNKVKETSIPKTETKLGTKIEAKQLVFLLAT